MGRLARLTFLTAAVAVLSGCSLIGMGIEPSEGPVAERAIRVSHILYVPNDDLGNVYELPLSDPAWATAEAEAREAAQTLRAIADPADRQAAFAQLAGVESDDTVTGGHGGSLGTIRREDVIAEFADPVFDTPSPSPGEIIGPVRTMFGWHVGMYEGEGDPSDVEER